MTSLRKTALVAGVFYLITFISIPTLGGAFWSRKPTPEEINVLHLAWADAAA